MQPKVLVALSAVAAGSLFGPRFRLTQHRGQKLPWPPDAGDFVDDDKPVQAAVATIHPSAVLRAPSDRRKEMYTGLVRDLQVVHDLLG